MSDTVPVTLELDPDTAAALADPATRARVERLFEAMDALAADAERRGLTDEILEAELAAHRGEPALAGKALAEAFRAFRRGRILGGLDPKALMREGLR